MTEESYLGKIEVSPHAIASIAGQAVLKCYGVVGMASKHPHADFAEILQGANFRRGVDVRFVDGNVTIALYVVIEYGTRVSEVALGIKNQVKFTVEHATGLPITEVNVHVQGLHVSTPV
jgi:uncharacterized alkaline shock family protein YloU